MSKVLRTLALSLAAGLVVTAVAAAQSSAPAEAGRRIYEQRCAGCHDNPTDSGAPALSAVQAMSAEAIRASLTTGAMAPAGISSTAPRRTVCCPTFHCTLLRS